MYIIQILYQNYCINIPFSLFNNFYSLDWHSRWQQTGTFNDSLALVSRNKSRQTFWQLAPRVVQKHKNFSSEGILRVIQIILIGLYAVVCISFILIGHAHNSDFSGKFNDSRVIGITDVINTDKAQCAGYLRHVFHNFLIFLQGIQFSGQRFIPAD